MRSCGLILPGSGTDPSRFYAFPRPAAARPLYPTRVRFAPIRAAASSMTGEGLAAGSTFYELLGIPETGTLPEIKQAYKQLARKYHPDVSPPDRVEEHTRRFIRVLEAYETLSDPRRRALYDRNMAKGLHLAFSARRSSSKFDEGFEDKSEWKSQWQSQISELKRRTIHKSSRGNMSWGARMRRQRDESADES
ncbi:chaperone protein dnaJ 20, chloroplastic-like [Punica granatum]|uniref:J domain-containing protein n=2 Tax=Punica granatum TaxID=22663 RepID=A0A218WVC3_PUNGR|nr:chaperone protein dnaJ 20, chloroplastic-like [Punica granatum]OWM76777.1 hypothetical protein CDL15_Pgr004989 [Punica granatum]PKI40150.1 hypothetical protein CRG98_039468 [Punica granatum]